MPDLLTLYAQAHPDKPAIIDDRAGGDVRTLSHAEFEDVTNRLAHVLRDLGAGPGVKVAWCGQNSTGVASLVVAARKIGATAVPVNYRFSEEEAAFVTDHSDASLVYVDAEFAPLFERVRERHPQGRRRPRLRWSDAGRHDRRRRPDGSRTERSAGGAAVRGGGRHDDLHVGHDGQAEGGAADQRRRSGRRSGRCCSSSATRPTTCTSRPARCTTAGQAASWASPWRSARPWCCSASSTRRTGCDSSRRIASRRRSPPRRRSA